MLTAVATTSSTRGTLARRTAWHRNYAKFADTRLSLEHFLLRDKCVKLWRDFLRATRNIPNPSARRETIDWLRQEHFEGQSGLRAQTDVTLIRERLVEGHVALKRICGPMELAGALNPTFGSFPKLVGHRALKQEA